MEKTRTQMMGDKLKIHPAVDVEAPPPTAPLMSRGLATSEKGGSSKSQQQPPLPLRTMPAAMQSSKPQKTRSCCCKCVCWTVGLLVLLLVTVGATAGILYLVFKPKIPNYSVDSLSISDLRLNFDMSLYAKFDVKITANNPNKKIGIYYEKGGLLSVWYSNTKLCAGSIPKILPRSPEHNKTGCELNRADTVRKHFIEGIARAATNRTYSIRS